jgi:hypothetical protein
MFDRREDTSSLVSSFTGSDSGRAAAAKLKLAVRITAKVRSTMLKSKKY